MGSFSVWHWAVLLLVVVVIGLLIRKARSIPKSLDSREISGFGGWLILLAFIQTFAPLRTLAAFVKGAEGYPAAAALPGGPVAVGGEIILSVALILLQVTTLILMYRKSQAFPRFFMWQCLALVGYVIVDWGLVSTSLAIPLDQLVGPDDLRTLFAAIVGSVIWIIYVNKSVRVRNTFVR